MARRHSEMARRLSELTRRTASARRRWELARRRSELGVSGESGEGESGEGGSGESGEGESGEVKTGGNKRSPPDVGRRFTGAPDGGVVTSKRWCSPGSEVSSDFQAKYSHELKILVLNCELQAAIVKIHGLVEELSKAHAQKKELEHALEKETEAEKLKHGRLQHARN
ncbi:unnamed protein product [Urochloa humidicola]